MAVPKHKVSKQRIRKRQKQFIYFVKKSFSCTKPCVYCKITEEEIFSYQLSDNLMCRGCINKLIRMRKRKKKL
jgi:ribosomal protein L32